MDGVTSLVCVFVGLCAAPSISQVHSELRISGVQVASRTRVCRTTHAPFPRQRASAYTNSDMPPHLPKIFLRGSWSHKNVTRGDSTRNQQLSANLSPPFYHHHSTERQTWTSRIPKDTLLLLDSSSRRISTRDPAKLVGPSIQRSGEEVTTRRTDREAYAI